MINTGGAANGLIVRYGNVGIGTANPRAKLDVVGTVRMPGFLLTGNSDIMNLPAGRTYTVLCWGTYFSCADYDTWLRLDSNKVKSYTGTGGMVCWQPDQLMPVISRAQFILRVILSAPEPVLRVWRVFKILIINLSL